ncbi:MAG: insulinase family protein [Xanthomonadales bacterium]|nr:insulinase family protein [Xanthomonadales bacterium]
MRTLLLAAALVAAPAAAVDIPFETFTLDNGLRVVVHTDRKAPIVAVNVWYHVGSKDEQPGKTGFAHLFEHLMFQGSENYPDEYFKPFELVGATDMNGTTNQDRTNYFQNVPTTALDLALWMESDRMGHFLGAVDQALLDEQRGVVQNEKRQSENQPYGQAFERLLAASYPAGHPYRHSPIGSMADLEAATMDDVRWWFRSWYGPNNAVLVLAGDIDVDTARERVTRYFGDIPAGPTLAQPAVAVAARTESTREEIADRVAQPRIYRAWNVPEFGQAELTHLRLLVQVLAGSAASRLDRRLVHGEQLADLVSGFVQGQQLSGGVILVANVKQGIDPARVEAILDEELARLLREGPTREELERARTAWRAGFVRRIERIGGFGGKADVLAECAVFTGDPGCFRAELGQVERARVADLRRAGRRWLAQGDHTLVVLPGERLPTPDDAPTAPHVEAPPVPAADPAFAVVETDVDRSAGPPVTERFPDLAFPTLQRATLDNGLRLVLARREGLPLVQMSLEFDGGFSADAGATLGTSGFAMAMLDEGAGERDALAFAAAAEALGAQIGSGAALDAHSVSLSALRDTLPAALDLFADTVLRPRFDAAEIERVRAQWLAQIAQEKTQPASLALRLLPPLMYGDGHAYGIPFTGSGTESSISALSRDDLVGFHRTWLRPDTATLVVVGDIAMADLKALVEARFGQWAAPAAPAPALDRHAVELPAGQRVFLIDQPGAIQANILYGQVVPPTGDASALAFDLANGVYGGTFTSRINMNLREDKSWSYGARSSASNAVGQRPWIGTAPVQIDKTAEAIAEIRRELAAFIGDNPASAEEIAKIRDSRIRSLPGAYETGSAVLAAVAGIVRYGRPDDYVQTLRAQIAGTSDEAVRASASVLDPDRLTWIVVGDLAQTAAPVRALALGEVQVLDADGAPVGEGDAPDPGEGAPADD